MVGSKAANKTPSHPKLNLRLRALGRTVARRRILARKKGARFASKAKAVQFFRTHYSVKGKKGRVARVAALRSKAFGSYWRNLQPAHDELFSTSSIREVITGMVEVLDQGAPTKADLANADDMLDEASALRMPTSGSGYATKNSVMQHMTRGTGIFGDPKMTVTEHADRDRKRKAQVVTAMEKAAKNPKASANAIIAAGNKAALEYTFNSFTLPSTALDTKRYIPPTVNKLAPKQLLQQDAQRVQQVKIREALKNHGVTHYGIEQESSTNTRLDRPSGGPDKRKRGFSPPRNT